MYKDSKILVRGTGDVGSVIALELFRVGYRVALHDEPAPTTPRRGMAFTDAVFNGAAVLDGLTARRVSSFSELHAMMSARQVVPVTTMPFGAILIAADWLALIDARMRKRAQPERQRGLVPITIGLGPNFVAGETVDLAIETSWGDRLGAIIEAGSTMALVGEPRVLGGIGRARFIYAPVAGRFETKLQIGDAVDAGEVVATLGVALLVAPIGGVIRGLTRSGVKVAIHTKVVEVDPRGNAVAVFGLGERPRRIAGGVLKALAQLRLLKT